MKRNFFLLFFITLIMNSLPAQEMQLSFGPEAAVAIYKVNNDIAFRNGIYGYFLNENTASSLFAPGISISMRVFGDDNTYSSGFFFRDRTIFVTNVTQTGTASINDTTVKISEKYSIKDTDFFISMMDFDFGTSTRFIISKRLQFYTDLGVNFTIMDYEDYETYDTSSYWGAGIFAALALQVNLTKTMYLEFGLNSIINAFSSQEGTYYLEDFNNKEIKYKDSGRWDLTSSAVYINIGWRLNLQELRKDMLNSYSE